jgi:hypothetical protein
MTIVNEYKRPNYAHYIQVHVSCMCSSQFQFQWSMEDKDIGTSRSTGIRQTVNAFNIGILCRTRCKQENKSKNGKTAHQIFLRETWYKIHDYELIIH